MTEPNVQESGTSAVDYAVAVKEFEKTHGRLPNPHERQAILDAERARCRARADVAELRERVAAAGIQLRAQTDPVMLAHVLDHVRDVDLAMEAILMEPRPQWVRTLIGADLMKVYPRG